MCIFPPPGVELGARKMIWFKYEIVQKRKSTFNLGLNAVQNAHYSKESVKYKSCSEFFFHFLYPYNLISQPCHLSSPLASLCGGGGHAHMPSRTFYPKFNAEKLLFAAFFGTMRIFGSIQPKSECIFPLQHDFIFKPYHLLNPIPPLWGRIHICPRGLFYLKFDAEKPLFEAFFFRDDAYFRQCSA